MIIRGNPAGNVGFWSKHLLRDDTNDRAEVKEISGLLAEDLPTALREMAAIAAQSRSHGNFMYQANINPQADEHLTDEQWREAVDTLEKNLGLEGHQRVVVEHEKEGRTHRHIIWNRVDENLRVADMGGNYRIHTATQKELENRFHLSPTPERDAEKKSAPELWEIRAAERSGIDPAAMKAELTGLWRATDTGKAFAAAIEERGYILAKGDRRDFCIVDQAGDAHSLARRLDGVKVKEVRAHMADIDREALPSVAEARATQRVRPAVILEPIQAPEPEASGPSIDAADWPEQIDVRDWPEPEEQRAWDEYEQDDSRPAAPIPEPPRKPYTPAPPIIDPRYQPKPAGPIIDPRQPELGKAAGEVRLAWNLGPSADKFATLLDATGKTLARVDPQEAAASQRANAFAKEIGNYAPRYKEGEIVVVNSFGSVQKLNERTTGQTPEQVTKKLGQLDPAALPSLTEAREGFKETARLRKETARLRQERQELIQKQQAARAATPTEKRIETLQNQATTDGAFAASLYREGLTIARVDKQGIEGLVLDETIAHQQGQPVFMPYVKVGQLVAVNRYGDVKPLNPQKVDLPAIEKALTQGARQIPELGAVREHIADERTADQKQREQQSAERAEHRRDREAEKKAAPSIANSILPPSAPVIEPHKSPVKAGLMVADSVTGCAEKLVDFVCGLLSGASSKPAPTPASMSQREQIIAQRKASAAIENMRESMARGENLRPSDICNLTPSHLENIKMSGDDYIKTLIRDAERTRERERDYGRERER